MKHSAYQNYRNSGINWIGDLPLEWGVSKIKFLGNLYTGNSLNDAEKALYESQDELDIPYISSKDIDVNTRAVNYENGLRIPPENLGFKKAPKGSFLICIEGGSAGKKIAKLSQDVNFVNKLCCIDAINTDYLYYFFQSLNFLDKFNLSMTGLIGGVSTSALKNFEIPIPTESEQRKICNFLDRETAKIDELIQKQEKLIQSLEEKKHISILEVMYLGLDESVVYDESPEIFWAKKVPKHWGKIRAKFIFEIKKRIAGELGHKVLSITQRGIKVRDIESNEGQLSMDYSKYQIVEPGDFAMNHMDLLTGYVDIASELGVTSPDYRVFSIRDVKRFVPDFYLLILQLCYKSKLFYPFGQGAAQLGRWRLPTDAFNNFIFPAPPVHEQKEICKVIYSQNEKIDALIEKATIAIELLKEHRSSLISSAVTGKIDVRNS